MIVLDRNTNLPIEPQRQAVEGDWVEVRSGEAIDRFEYHPLVIIPDSTKINVKITSAIVTDAANPTGKEQTDDYRIKVQKGGETTFTIQMQDESGTVLSHIGTAQTPEHFAPPIEGLLGAQGRTIGADIIAGICTLKIIWPNEGEWKITQDALNMYVDTRVIEYLFSTLNISVYEPSLA